MIWNRCAYRIKDFFLKKFQFSKKYRIIGKIRQNIGLYRTNFKNRGLYRTNFKNIGLYRTNFKNIGNIGLLRGQSKSKSRREKTRDIWNLKAKIDRKQIVGERNWGFQSRTWEKSSKFSILTEKKREICGLRGEIARKIQSRREKYREFCDFKGKNVENEV